MVIYSLRASLCFLFLAACFTATAGGSYAWADTCGLEEIKGIIPAPTHFVLARPVPAIPVVNKPFDETAIELLLKEVPEEYHEAYQFLVNELRSSHVDFKTFRSSLETAAKDFEEKNWPTLNSGKFAAFAYAKKNGAIKSNRWVLELLMERKQILGFPSQMNAFTDPKELLAFAKAESIKDVIIVDDASFSGAQLGTILRNLDAVAEEPVTVHIIIPYMTAESEKWSIAIPRKNLNLKLYAHQTIPTFQSQISAAMKENHLSSKAAEQLQNLFKFDEGESLTFFDHKAPDFVSIVNNKGMRNTTVLETVVLPDGSQIPKIQIVKPIQPPYRPN